MKSRNRERALRTLLTAFLKSELTVREIRDLSREMESPSFLGEFRVLLQGVVEKLESRPAKQSAPREIPLAFRDIQSSLYEAIQRRRISKKELLELMEKVYPEITRKGWSKDVPVRELVREFVTAVPLDKANDFLSLLDPRGGEDAYLQGIIRRR